MAGSITTAIVGILIVNWSTGALYFYVTTSTKPTVDYVRESLTG